MTWGRLAVRAGVGWGLGLWLFGYALGFVFFALVPAGMIGWCIMPIGVAVTMLVLRKWVRPGSLGEGLAIGAIWCAVAVVLDYLFIVKLLAPAGGYYKPDVYIYYAATLALPAIAAALWGSGRVATH